MSIRRMPLPQELKHRALQPNEMLAKGQQQACEGLERKIQKLPGDPDLKVGDPAEVVRQEKGESRRYR